MFNILIIIIISVVYIYFFLFEKLFEMIITKLTVIIFLNSNKISRCSTCVPRSIFERFHFIGIELFPSIARSSSVSNYRASPRFVRFIHSSKFPGCYFLIPLSSLWTKTTIQFYGSSSKLRINYFGNFLTIVPIPTVKIQYLSHLRPFGVRRRICTLMQIRWFYLAWKCRSWLKSTKYINSFNVNCARCNGRLSTHVE